MTLLINGDPPGVNGLIYIFWIREILKLKGPKTIIVIHNFGVTLPATGEMLGNPLVICIVPGMDVMHSTKYM